MLCIVAFYTLGTPQCPPTRSGHKGGESLVHLAFPEAAGHFVINQYQSDENRKESRVMVDSVSSPSGMARSQLDVPSTLELGSSHP